jgi:membrane protease YdiL (CAAX protease family)
MGRLIEPLILYVILFLPGAMKAGPQADLAAFSAAGELRRIFLFNIPSLALIWYLLLRPASRFSPEKKQLPRFCLQDLYSALFALPALLLIGFSIALVSSHFEIPAGINIEAPSGISGWTVMALSCLSTGYLEESYFRRYLLGRLEAFGLSPLMAILTGVLLFSFCHIYEGPWGALNAFLAGTMLSLIFVRFRALHGIALAHGLYNIFVYAMGV